MAEFLSGTNNDDVYDSGSFIQLAASPFFGNVGATGYQAGQRIQAVTIPKGSTIVTAVLRVQAKSSLSGTTVNGTIKGEAVDDAAVFSTHADFAGRARTTASVAWNNVSAWTANTDYNSPDISTIVQEIIDRAGWVSGYDMVFFIENNGSTAGQYRQYKGYVDSSTVCPRLVVTWTEPSTGQPITKRFGGIPFMGQKGVW